MVKILVKILEKSDTSLAAKDALNLCVKEIAWNLGSLMRQADVLETSILKRKKHMCEYIAAEKAAEELEISFVPKAMSRF